MNVLVIDDENLIRKSLRRVFESRGHIVAEAADGVSGLEAWRKFEPDLVVLDVLMPGLTGPQLLQKIGQHKAKVVLISAYAGDFDINKIREIGANMFIAKPFQDIFDVVTKAESL